MIPKSVFEKLIDVNLYIHIREVNEKFSGKLMEITDDDLLLLEDKYNNITYIPISDVCVVTERR